MTHIPPLTRTLFSLACCCRSERYLCKSVLVQVSPHFHQHVQRTTAANNKKCSFTYSNNASMAESVSERSTSTVIVLLSSGTATKTCYMDYFYSSPSCLLFVICLCSAWRNPSVSTCRETAGQNWKQRLTQFLRFILMTVRNKEIK